MNKRKIEPEQEKVIYFGVVALLDHVTAGTPGVEEVKINLVDDGAQLLGMLPVYRTEEAARAAFPDDYVFPVPFVVEKPPQPTGLWTKVKEIIRRGRDSE